MRPDHDPNAQADRATSFGRVFLDLLNSESPVTEFERPIPEACAAGATPAVLAELEAAKLVALHVRAEIEERRRREAELAALFDTASDLAALHDLDSVRARSFAALACCSAATWPTSRSTTLVPGTRTCG